MTQLMETSAVAQQIGLCQVGGFEYEAVRHWFALDEEHVYLHGLLGGAIDATQTQLAALVDDSHSAQVVLDAFQEQLGGNGGSKDLASPDGSGLENDRRIVNSVLDFVKRRLPAYMVPATLVTLDALPLTSNGKVDRRKLPEPDLAVSEESEGFVAPQTELERVIAVAWQEVLELERVGIHDNFFDLGGNSVHVIQVHNKLRETLGQDLTIVKLFEHTTVHSLSKFLSQSEDKQPSSMRGDERGTARRASRRRRRQTLQKE
jgi:aryl carrier-like protein